MRYIIMTLAVLLFSAVPGCGQRGEGRVSAGKTFEKEKADMQKSTDKSLQAITDTVVLGGGCFWCFEAVFDRIDGVVSVEAGYAGGMVENPTYEQVCSGSTGHAEVARIVFDPAKTSFGELLDVFWQAHDPTTLNRQGADVGTQYRSAIFTMTDEQLRLAEESKRKAQTGLEEMIVTEITPLKHFYAAENYHQDYYNRNRNAPYCQVVIRPKLKKMNLE
jgi:peptide-methionine (S)-S-oxide reductase